jgi:hypothetical protein
MAVETPELEELALDTPPDEKFWRKHNAHYEAPIGFALSVLSHVALIVILVFGFLSLMNAGNDKKPVQITNLDGDDDSGVGSLGGGGTPEPLAVGQQPIDPDISQLQLNQPIAQVKEELQERLKLDDPTAVAPIPDAAAAAIASLDRSLQDKIMGIGQKKGRGNGDGGDGDGAGNGGTGSDSTRARGMRWILRFSTKSGNDYIGQLKALKAVVMVPVPPENKKMIYLKDLNNLATNVYATDADIQAQNNKIQFSDIRKDSCEAISEALRLGFTPSSFWAFFPKDLEETMSRLEIAYQNKKSEEIRETVFQVIVRGNTPQLTVVAQRLK